MSSEYPRNDHNDASQRHIPPPFPQSAHSRPESPRAMPNADDYLLGSPQWQNNQAGRALTPNISPAPSSPILPAAQRPFYGQNSAAPSAEFLLPAPPSSRGSSRNEFQQFNFNHSNPTNPGFPQHPLRNSNSASHMSYHSYDNNGFIEGYIGGPRPPYESWTGRSTPSLMSRNNPFATPRDWDSQSLADDRSLNPSSDNMNSLAEKFSIEPNSDLIIYPNEVEADDEMHTPDEKDGQKKVDLNIWTKRGCVNLGFLILLVGGLMFLFIGYPIMTFVRELLRANGPAPKSTLQCEGWQCLDVPNPPLLKNARVGLIDPDTPKSAMTKKGTDGSTLKLTFSDEFNQKGRSFYEGDDPYFEAVDLWYAGTQDLEWYDPDAVTTKNGYLEITFDLFNNHDLAYRSGMVQTWNKMCMKGGLIEVSVSLPGDGKTSGFWPGVWTLGNLARAGYQSTSEGMWPYSYHDKCDIGITPNQSSSDGLSWLPGMRMPACTCEGADHPSPGISRSAPEIDIIEATVGQIDQKGTITGLVSQSNQVAPFDIWYQPNYDFYAVNNKSITTINSYRGGPFQQAMSGLTTLNPDWYSDGGKQFQTYAFDYTPGLEGQITWRVGDENVWTMRAESMGANGNVGPRPVSNEPMYLIMNLGASESFAKLDPNFKKHLPGKLQVDYVRVYQPESGELTCDPEGYPSTEFIEKHPKAYRNRELLVWEDTGYEWPKNSFMGGC